MQYWTVTDPGCVREQNQDVCQVEELDRGGLLCVVCDGMGGARSGNVASSLALDVFTQAVRDGWKPAMAAEDLDQMLCSAVKLANYAVYDQAMQFEDFAGMGTTLVAALIQGRQATVVNVGDSRAYHIGQNGIRAVTTDHSVVQLMMARGELTPEQARTYPGKNLITRAIGTEPAVQCDVFHVILEQEDHMLLCSDGLTNLVDEQELLFEVVHDPRRQDCCRRLLEIALNRGAPDNVTCILVQL